MVVVHPSERTHAESLETAAVGEDGARPPHEPVQAAQPVNGIHPRAQVKVVGVAQDNLRPQVHNLVGREGLDSGLGSHGHEDGRFHGAVGRGELPGPGAAVAVVELEGEGLLSHGDSLAGCRRRTASRIISIVITMHMQPGMPSRTQSSILLRKASSAAALPTCPMPMARAPLSTVIP